VVWGGEFGRTRRMIKERMAQADSICSNIVASRPTNPNPNVKALRSDNLPLTL
jgi:hypothetical protein